MEHVGKIFMPGDVLSNLQASQKSGKVVLGPGLKCDNDSVFVNKPGVLKHKEPNFYWIDSHQKKYVPTRGEHVLGVVTNRMGDVYRVDIRGSEPASLSFLSFEGATKRNRPDIKIGDLVYGKLLCANKDIEPEMVCIDSTGRSNGMGVISCNGGFMFTCSLNHIRKILSPQFNLLKTLGNSLPFEVAVGMNGRIWVKGRSIKETIAIVNGLNSVEYMDTNEIKVMCRKLLDTLAGF
ncbi:unnamed protein product [Owenia fusiformis]|uniref:Exosome complex component RRP40 n=1 Tax=Owenia fusiformis TaxID=6347 RepID=A0A8J1UW93_OWEFU|nr:unnamed protein product [Owenia fusiformis]